MYIFCFLGLFVLFIHNITEYSLGNRQFHFKVAPNTLFLLFHSLHPHSIRSSGTLELLLYSDFPIMICEVGWCIDQWQWIQWCVYLCIMILKQLYRGTVISAIIKYQYKISGSAISIGGVRNLFWVKPITGTNIFELDHNS